MCIYYDKTITKLKSATHVGWTPDTGGMAWRLGNTGLGYTGGSPGIILAPENGTAVEYGE